VMTLLRIPSILLVCLSLVISASVWSILDPILEPHLRVVGIRVWLVISRLLLITVHINTFDFITCLRVATDVTFSGRVTGLCFLR
jgi:hypothetical protein